MEIAKLLEDRNYPLEKIKYPIKKYISVDFPLVIEYKGLQYWYYDKLGYRKTDNCPSACYSCEDNGVEKRLWLDADGTIAAD